MSRWFQGWRLVGVASAALVASQALLFAAGGTDEAGLRLLVAVSARISVVLFLLVFIAAPARRFWPNETTRWMLRNRRYLGVSFGVAHFIHLFDIVLLATLLGSGFEMNAATLYGGGLAYVLLAAMMATSFDRRSMRFSARNFATILSTTRSSRSSPPRNESPEVPSTS